MIDTYVKNLKHFLQDRKPKTLIILGSGLGALADKPSNAITVGYKDLGFPVGTVSGHAGKLICGRLGGKDVLFMCGRFHLYEGHCPALIKEIMCAFARSGIKKLIVTNAAGSLRSDMPAGSLMMISDHINLSGQNPLVGVNDERYGVRFPDMSDAYSIACRRNAARIARDHDIRLYEGVYLMVLGPNFETPAEVRTFAKLGADAVGMSTVPEVLSAIYAGMNVLGFSVITNLGTGLQKERQSHEETLQKADEASENLARLIELYLKEE